MKTTHYRAWDSQIKEMFDVDYIDFSRDLVCVKSLKRNHCQTTRLIIDDICTLLKNSGLKMKGEEVFEGDIFEFKEHSGYVIESFIGEVCFDSEKACFGYKSSKSMFPDVIFPFCQHDELKEDILDHCEIIGNIYEK